MRHLIPFIGLLIMLPLLAPTPLAMARERAPEPGKVHDLTTVHERAWSLYVPKRYSKKTSWPLVISSHGRGGSGKGEMRAWPTLAEKHGFIVACPDMVTATHNRETKSDLPGWKEDDEVLLAIVEAIGTQFNVNRRAVMITGFSGGGNPSYHSGLGHPDVFTHICTRGGNFSPQQVPTNKDVLAKGTPKQHIYIFYGEKDHPLIVGEGGQPGAAGNAHAALEAAGYKHLVIEKVPGMKHESRPGKAAAWFGEWLAANKKRFKTADKADAAMAKAHVAIEKNKPADAIKHLLAALEIQEEAKLDLEAKPLLESFEQRAHAELEGARALHDAGDKAGAKKAVQTLMRNYRGLPVVDEAKAQLTAWRKAD